MAFHLCQISPVLTLCQAHDPLTAESCESALSHSSLLFQEALTFQDVEVTFSQEEWGWYTIQNC